MVRLPVGVPAEMMVREASGHALTLPPDSGSVALSMRHHEHERRRDDRRDERAPERPKPIHNVLALQRTAGNQAVAAMLARQPVVAETTGGTAKQQELGMVKVTKIGVIPILSFSMGSSSGRGHEATDYSFMSAVGTHSAKLMEALMSGTVVDAEVDVKSFKLKIAGALVSQYSSGDSQGEPIEHWSLTPRSARLDDGSGGGGGGGGSWDVGGRQPG